MRQVLFHIPGTEGWFPPEGVPVHGFGVMLFITFIVCVWFLGWRSRRTGTGLPRERIQDLVIVVFVGGLLGARITYLVQYDRPLKEIFRIWEGGIVLYGGIITGILAFLLFYRYVLKRGGVSLWKLGDVAGPCLALGIALGRIGCFLNGCCYGHVAPEGCPAVAFPLMSAPARERVVDMYDFQTPTGFTVVNASNDIRSVVDHVESGSAASRAGLQAGDRIVGVNGHKNTGLLLVISDEAQVLELARSMAEEEGATVESESDGGTPSLRILVDDPKKFQTLQTHLNGRFFPFRVHVIATDVFSELVKQVNWPRGDQSLTLEVERGGQTVGVGTFTPRTLGLHPTQLYEVISMGLLIFFLLSYYPFRVYDGQLFTLFVAVYAIHRFLNETLRDDTDIVGIKQLHMTISQNISILMLLFAACLEFGRRRWGRRFAALPMSTRAAVASK